MTSCHKIHVVKNHDQLANCTADEMHPVNRVYVVIQVVSYGLWHCVCYCDNSCCNVKVKSRQLQVAK